MSDIEDESPKPAAAAPADEHDRDVAQLEREAARTRAQLGETVDALGAKLDVRSRATEQANVARATVTRAVVRARDAGTDQHGRPVPAVWIALGVTTAASVGVVLLVRARR